MTILASRGSLNRFPEVIKMIENGQIDTSSWITHRLELNDVPHRFAELRGQANLVKAMIHVENSPS